MGQSQPKFSLAGFPFYVVWAQAQCVQGGLETPEQCADWKSRAGKTLVFPDELADQVQVKDTSGNTVMECTPYGAPSCVVVEGPLKGELPLSSVTCPHPVIDYCSVQSNNQLQEVNCDGGMHSTRINSCL